jgi:Domain of unknown function (DUF4397)
MTLTRRFYAFALALPLLAGCGNDFGPSNPTNDAALRVINGSPDVGQMDFFIENAKFVQGIGYPSAAPYSRLTEATRTVTARETGNDLPLASVSQAFAAHTSYTIAAIGLAGARELLAVTDDDTPAASGSFKLRVVRLAPGGPAMDLYVTAPNADLATATPTFAGIGYKDVQGYVTLPTGPGRIRVTGSGNPTVVLIDASSLTFVDNQISTVYIVGSPGQSGGGAPYSGLFVGDGGLH